MKKLVSLFFAIITVALSAVTAFAGAPDPFEGLDGVINTGGDFMTIMIIAIVAAVLAVVVGLLVIFTGKKEK